MRLVGFVLLLLPLAISAQDASGDVELEAIRQTLPAFLDQYSIVGITKGHKTYRMTNQILRFECRHAKGRKAKKEAREVRRMFEAMVDSIEHVLQHSQVYVPLSDTLYAFRYQPYDESDYRSAEDWEYLYSSNYDDFDRNNLVIFDTIIGVEYLDLVKQQIDLQAPDRPIKSRDLSNGSYAFIPKDACACQDRITCDNESPCFKAGKVYRPVFNNDTTRGCYLVSRFNRHNEIIPMFVFIRKRQDRWVYVDKWYGRSILGR